MEKSNFVKIIKAIQYQEKIDEQIDKALKGLSPDNTFISSCNMLIDTIISVIETEMKDTNQWIEWWLYEDVEHVVTWTEDGQEKTVNIQTPEDLYDFLIMNYEGSN